ncbi:MAG: MFS transporter [Hyphomicrobiales bacterium]
MVQSEDAENTENTLSLRLSIFYGALFLGLGVYLPFFPVWLRAQGLDAGEISVVLACQMAVRIGSGPWFSFLADRTQSRRGLLIALSAAALASLCLLAVVEGFVAIVIVATVASAVWTPILPLIETLTVAESEAGRADYGRTRLWGSLTFILGSIGGGYVLKSADPGSVLWMLVGSYALMTAASLALPGDTRSAAPGAGTAKGRIRFANVLPVVGNPLFLTFLGAASLIQASHAFYYGFGTLHWQSLGIDDGVIGALWSLGVIAEVILFMVSRRAVTAIGPVGLIVAGGLGALVRWTLTAFDPGVEWLFVIQAGHGLTFGAAHLGAMHFIARAAPADYHATAQGVYGAFSGGIVMAVVMAASGTLYAQYGGHGYLVMAVFGALGAILGAVLLRRWNGGRLVTSA